MSQVLDGMAFSLTGSFSGLTLNSVTADSIAKPFLDCTAGNCVASAAFKDYQNNVTVSSPYTWGLVGSELIGGASDGGTPYHPGGIANDSSIGTKVNQSGPHNDYLLDFATFNLGYTGNITDVTAATFKWGTVPNSTTGVRCTTCTGSIPPVPEPSSVFLLSTAALGIGFSLRRRFVRLG